MRAGFHYKARFVRHSDSPKGPVTSFQIGTQNKKTEKWTNYKIIVWGNLPIAESEDIEITKILGVDLDDYENRDGEMVSECKILALVSKRNEAPDV